jgi:hypothetical protein
MGPRRDRVVRPMNLAKLWRQRRWLVHELNERLVRLQDTINNRNDLIRMQDEEITRLRRLAKDLEQDRDYWQGKAANP